MSCLADAKSRTPIKPETFSANCQNLGEASGVPVSHLQFACWPGLAWLPA